MPSPTPIGLFRGEKALVTGSACNIGRAIALALAQEGASVRLIDIDTERNASLAAQIVAAGGSAEAVTVDLSSKEVGARRGRSWCPPCSCIPPRRRARR